MLAWTDCSPCGWSFVGCPVAGGVQQALEVLTARAAGEQVRRYSGELPLHRARIVEQFAIKEQLNVDVQHVHGLVASDIAGIGAQELLQYLPGRHACLASS